MLQTFETSTPKPIDHVLGTTRMSGRKPTTSPFLALGVSMAIFSLLPVTAILVRNSCLMLIVSNEPVASTETNCVLIWKQFAISLSIFVFMECIFTLFTFQVLKEGRIDTQEPLVIIFESLGSSTKRAIIDFARVHLRCCPFDSNSCCDQEFFDLHGVRCTIRQYKQSCTQVISESIQGNAAIILFIIAEMFLIQFIALFDTWFLVKSFSNRSNHEYVGNNLSVS